MTLLTIEAAAGATAPRTLAAELIRLADILGVRIRVTLVNGHVVYAEPGDRAETLHGVLEEALHAS